MKILILTLLSFQLFAQQNLSEQLTQQPWRLNNDNFTNYLLAPQLKVDSSISLHGKKEYQYHPVTQVELLATHLTELKFDDKHIEFQYFLFKEDGTFELGYLNHPDVWICGFGKFYIQNGKWKTVNNNLLKLTFHSFSVGFEDEDAPIMMEQVTYQVEMSEQKLLLKFKDLKFEEL